MKKHLYFKSILFFYMNLLLIPVFAQNDLPTPSTQSRKVSKSDEREDKPFDRAKAEYELVKDQSTGEVPYEQLVLAREALRLKNQQQTNVGIAGVTWKERGPNNVGGRVRAMMLDPNDKANNTVWAGGVAGGLWYNNDITDANSQWNKIDDFWDNLAISCIAYNPIKSNFFYVGTGEGWFNIDGVAGGGIWRSTNQGTNWSLLTSTLPNYSSSTAFNSKEFAFRYVQKIVCTFQGTVLAGTQYGIWRSTDDGMTWTMVHAPQPANSNYGVNFCSDLEFHDGIIYAGFGRGTGSKVYKSSDDGLTWLDITPPGIVGGRTELAVATLALNNPLSYKTVIYAVADTSFSYIGWFKKSMDGGATWTDLTIPTEESLDQDLTNGQAWYDLILGINPQDANTVLLGGASFARSGDGGMTWKTFPYWNDVHPDHHAFLFRQGSSEVIMGNDGGVYYSTTFANPKLNIFDFVPRNNGFNVSQPYAVANKNIKDDNYLLFGMQDNGTKKINSPPNTIGSATDVGGGDGMFCFIDQDQPDIRIGSFQYNTHYSIDPSTDEPAYYLADPYQDYGQFINPCDYDSENNTFYSYIARNSSGSIYHINQTVINTFNDFTSSLKSFAPGVSNMSISHIKAGRTPNVMYFGTTSGRVFRVTNMDATPVATQIAPAPLPSGGFGAAVSSIDFGASENEILVTFSSYNAISVRYSNNGGATWVAKDNAAGTFGLPNMPVRWGIFNPLNRKEVLLATELGVWSTTDITAANPGWQSTNASLANVRCDMLRYRLLDRSLFVATHGRGIFSTTLNTPCPSNVVMSNTVPSNLSIESDNTITGNQSNTILSGAKVTYDARNSIILNPKFEAKAGSTFLAFIDGCGNIITQTNNTDKK
jgi:hypothetical protein